VETGAGAGVGCAGRGIITAIELLKQKKILEEFSPDIIIYDVLDDVVCGGFAMPIREGVAEQVYTVSSSDFMSLYASNNLFKGIKKYSNSGGALFSGIIGNSINLPIQEEIIQDFAANTKVTIAGFVPRSLTVAKAELQGKTTIEAIPIRTRPSFIGTWPAASSTTRIGMYQDLWNRRAEGLG